MNDDGSESSVGKAILFEIPLEKTDWVEEAEEDDGIELVETAIEVVATSALVVIGLDEVALDGIELDEGV